MNKPSMSSRLESVLKPKHHDYETGRQRLGTTEILNHAFYRNKGKEIPKIKIPLEHGVNLWKARA